MDMKKIILRSALLIITLLIAIPTFSSDKDKLFKAYIQDHKDLAIFHMKEYKIPASIKLAQAILESTAGTSDLAAISNNHFGIKCKGGEKLIALHPRDGEPYRKYTTIENSYLDHSLFLTKRPWYKFLFTLDITDYKGWARGLVEAGYATDPAYADKLIDIIERYKLDLYDML